MARRFDPQWRPTFAPGRDDDPDDPDDIGWDDGSGYDGGPRHGRRPRTGVVILGVCALVTAVVSVGLTVAESRLSVKHNGLVSDCSDAVVGMDTEHDRLEARVERMNAMLDMPTLRQSNPSLADTYAELRRVADSLDISCPTDADNDTLTERAVKASRRTSAYRRQIKRIERFEQAASDLLDSSQQEDDATRLEEDISQAQDLLDRTQDMELKVPYLRTRLSDSLDQARSSTDSDDKGRMADLLEDLMGQVRESADLTDQQ